MQMTIKHYEKTVLLNGRYYEEPKKEAWSARKKLPSKESVRRTRSRTTGALRGIWGSPQQAETGRFSLWRKSLGLPKGYHTALLASQLQAEKLQCR